MRAKEGLGRLCRIYRYPVKGCIKEGKNENEEERDIGVVLF